MMMRHPIRLASGAVLAMLLFATLGPEPAGFWVPAGYVAQADTLIAQHRLRLSCGEQDSVIADFAPGSGEERFFTLSYLRSDVRTFNESPDASRSPFLLEGCALRGVDPFYHRIDLPFNRVPRWRGDVSFTADYGGATLEGGRTQQLDLRHPVDARDASTRAIAVSPEQRALRVQATLLQLRRPYSREVVADFYFVGSSPVLAERADVGAGDRVRVNGFGVPPGRIVRLESGDWIEVDVGEAAAGDGSAGRPGVYTYLTQMGERARAASFVRIRDERVERLFPAARLRPLIEPFSQAIDLALQSIPGGGDADAAIANTDVRLTLDRELSHRLDASVIEWCERRRHATRPRAVSLLVMDAFTGAVRAVPSCPGEDELAPYEPLSSRERHSFLRNQNLVPHPVGSAAKPFWAAALASTFPNFLDLRVPGHAAGPAGDVLGCPLRAAYHDAHGATGAVGLEEFIERSCNRYLIESATAAFAVDGGPSRVQCTRELSAAAFAGCFPATEPGEGTPLEVCDRVIRVVLSDDLDVTGRSCQELKLVHAEFPAARAFGAITNASTYRDLSPGRDGSGRAAALAERYRAGRYRIDAWEPVLHAIAEAGDTAHLAQTALRFASVSPQATNLALNTVEELRTDWINLLLGGENSRWTNFELAEAMARLMTGRAVAGVFVDSVAGFAPATPALLPTETLHSGARRRVLHAMERVVEGGGTARRLETAVASLEERLAVAVPGQPYDVYVFAKTGTPAVEKFASNAQHRLVQRLYRRGDLAWDARRRSFAMRPGVEAAIRRDQGDRTLRWLRDDVLEPMRQDPAAFIARPGDPPPAHPLYFDGNGRLHVRATTDLRVSRQGGVLLLGILAVPRDQGRDASTRYADWVSACALDPDLRRRILEIPPADRLDPQRAVALSMAVYLDDLAFGQGSGFAVELAAGVLGDIGDYLEREVRLRVART
ncbi:MAG: hypothetical protein ACRELX_18340, partial [Longimicrobiales bacterium]